MPLSWRTSPAAEVTIENYPIEYIDNNSFSHCQCIFTQGKRTCSFSYYRLIINSIIKLNKYSFRLMLHIYIVKDPHSSLHFSRHLMQIFEDCSCHAPALNSRLGIWHQAEDHPYCQYSYNHQILLDLSKPDVPENHGNHPRYKISSLQYAQGYGQTRHIGIL